MITPVRAQATMCTPYAAHVPNVAPSDRLAAEDDASASPADALGDSECAHAIPHGAHASKMPTYLLGPRVSPPPTSLAAGSDGSRFFVHTTSINCPTHPPRADYASPVISQQHDCKSSVGSCGVARREGQTRSPPAAPAATQPPVAAALAKEDGVGGHWSQRSLDGSAPTSTAAANASCQWLGRTVRVTRGKGEGQQGIVTKSGHGFYCVQVSEDETLMKRGHEIELVGGGSLRPKAPRSPALSPGAKQLAARATSPGGRALGGVSKDGPRHAPPQASRMVMRSPSPPAGSTLLPEPALPVHAAAGAPQRCEECARVHGGGFGSGRFCSKSCGARFAVRSRALPIPTPVSSLSTPREGADAPAYHAPIALKAREGAGASGSAAFLSAAPSPMAARLPHKRPPTPVPLAAGAEPDSEAALAARALLRIMSASSVHGPEAYGGAFDSLAKRPRVN